MILVITHTQERNRYDVHGRLLSEKGEVFVSHGVDLSTGKVVILPEVKWRHFSHECFYYEGEWYLKGN